METILDVLHRLLHQKPLTEPEQKQAAEIIDSSTHLLPKDETGPQLDPLFPFEPSSTDPSASAAAPSSATPGDPTDGSGPSSGKAANGGK